jgi:hypothetical protein
MYQLLANEPKTVFPSVFLDSLWSSVFGTSTPEKTYVSSPHLPPLQVNFLGIGIIGCVGVCGLFFLGTSFFQSDNQLRADVKAKDEEIARLNTQTRQLILHSSNLKKKSDRLQEENDRVLVRVQSLENKLLELVSSVINQNPSGQLNLVKSIYKEQIIELAEENARLKKKNEVLREELYCSVCMSQETNCVLRPCGHSICTECFYEIRRRADSLSNSKNKLPLCPFCRNEVVEVMPKFH